MTVRAPLSVRIRAGGADRHVTGKVSGLRFGKTAPGGYQSASMTVAIDRDEFPNLSAASRLFIYGPTGRTIWEGFLDNPASTDGPGGQSLELSALGSSVIAQDQSRSLVYIDRDLGGWEQYLGTAASGTSAPSSSAGSADDPTGSGVQGLLCQFNPGQPIGTNSVAQVDYAGFARAGMEWGASRVLVRSGKIDAGYNVEMVYSGPSIAAGWIALQTSLSTSVATANRFTGAGVGHPPAGTDAIRYRLKRTGGATNIADDDTWTFFAGITMCGRRMLRDGTLVDSAGMVTNEYVRADWVVEDLLGRSLGALIDPVLSTVEPTTYQIDQLAYHDGATAGQVLEDLELWEPTMLWEILEHTGRGYRFNYRAWPTSPRYEISTRDAYSAPGGDVDLCNRIAVKWSDEKGNARTTIVYGASAVGVTPPGAPAGTVATVFSPALVELEKMGRLRDAEAITLPEGRGSAANAQWIGEQMLASKASPPKAATAVVRRRIMDNLTGRWVAPWEIEAGYMVQVRETGDLMPLTEVQYDDDDNSSALTLGRPTLTVEQRVARLDKAA